ncbi:MAG: hypothetical protein AABY22_12510 [Nanoarchaeota archaeon]
MPYNQRDLGAKCPYCPTGKIIQFRSGKFGCGEKCWLKKDSPPQPQNSPQSDFQPKEDKISVAVEMMAKLDILIKASKAILQESNPEAYDDVFNK